MTQQLYTWEYKGKQEYGTKDSGLWPLWIMNHEPDKKGNTRFRRQLNEVTDLRLAKVVDASAIVIGLEDAKNFITSIRCALKDLETRGIYHPTLVELMHRLFNTPPPVTEPTGFGAIVEAEAKHYEGERTRFVRATLGSQPNWFCDTIRQKVGDREQVIRYYWSDLTNPVVISEGVTK